MKGRRVLVFSRDPGGTNAVMQLIEPLRALGNEVIVYGKDAALSIYRKLNMACTDIQYAMPSGAQVNVGELLRQISPELIVTGTSSEDFTERHLWNAAEQAGITSFAVLDQWTNYRLRLIAEEDDLANKGPKESALILPSFFFLMDEFAKSEMCALGIDPKKLLVTGQPYFDYIRKSGNRFAPHDIETLRRKLLGDKDGLIFVFASQPIATIHRQNGMEEDHWGYTETTVLSSVVACLGELTKELGVNVTLVVRLHPKDEPDAYHCALATWPRSINLVFDRDTDSCHLLKSTDLVIGMFSMILLEAAILERRFISVQIGLKRENPLILDRIGLVRSIVTEDQLEEAFRDILDGKSQGCPKPKFDFGATERIIQHLEGYS